MFLCCHFCRPSSCGSIWILGSRSSLDGETKSNKEIMENIKKILGKNKETLEKEE